MPDPMAIVKAAFFDRPMVMKKVAAAKRRAITKQLAFIRIRAKTSIRKRKKSSPVGQPPSSHSGEMRLIFFSWDFATESGVVGPIGFASKTGGRGQVPALLENGGDVTRTLPSGLKKLMHYGGNPYMAPAEAAERARFAGQFKDEVK